VNRMCPDLAVCPDDRVVCFAAHPDDETIGLGGHLPFLRDVWIVHATDGAPRDMADAAANGFADRESYARARRDELLEALHVARVPQDRAIALGLVDQDCAHRLPELARLIADTLRELRPGAVFVPPYEGGHPDHDSLAWAVSVACRLLERERRGGPRVIEHALYHAGPAGLETACFLPACAPVTKVSLTPSMVHYKKRMLACFTTQQATLSLFSTARECFRDAPRYDFAEPPHPGRLFYENFDWGVTGAEWRRLANDAESVLR
jgi:LmbE family N-acetylglucosaminyl deacetylase